MPPKDPRRDTIMRGVPRQPTPTEKTRRARANNQEEDNTDPKDNTMIAATRILDPLNFTTINHFAVSPFCIHCCSRLLLSVGMEYFIQCEGFFHEFDVGRICVGNLQ